MPQEVEPLSQFELWINALGVVFLLLLILGWCLNAPDAVWGLFLVLAGTSSARNFYLYFTKDKSIKREVEKFIEEFESQ